jgi:thiamine pyrophosphokinase
MMKKVLIIANGSIHPDLLSRKVNEYDRVICADGGARFALDNGISPDLVIGDLDSLDKRYQEELRRKGITMDIHPVQKDATDLELALKKAVADKPSSITIIGGWGSRWDHSLINLHLMAAFTAGDLTIQMLNEWNTARVAVPGCRVPVQGLAGDSVSLVPLTPTVNGVTTEGFSYPLRKASLTFGSSLPVSNSLTGETGSVFIEEGILLVLHYYDKLAVNFDF